MKKGHKGKMFGNVGVVSEGRSVISDSITIIPSKPLFEQN